MRVSAGCDRDRPAARRDSFLFGFTVARTTITLFSASNQNGAPSEIAIIVDASTGLSLQVSGVLVNAIGFIAVGTGAALGAWMRWGLSAALNHLFVNLPLGTFASNMIGGYLIGVAVEVAVHHSVLTPELRLFVMTGFLGGLTTFSTFSAEAVGLLTRQQYGWAIMLILAHLLGSLAMTIFGMMTVRALSG